MYKMIWDYALLSKYCCKYSYLILDIIRNGRKLENINKNYSWNSFPIRSFTCKQSKVPL